MAKIGQFLQVTDIRGKVGGQVFTRGNSGATLRARVKGKNPRSFAQETLRGVLTSATRAAIGLSKANIVLWKTWAASVTKHNTTSGNAYHPTWLNEFNALSANLVLAGTNAPSPFTPPTTPYTSTVLALTASSATAGQVTLTSTAPNAESEVTAIYLGLVKGTARTPTAKMLRYHGHVVFTEQALTTVITGLITGRTYAFGYKLIDSDTGQAGNVTFEGSYTVT